MFGIAVIGSGDRMNCREMFQARSPLSRAGSRTHASARHSGQTGYWPKEGQAVPETLCDPATGALDPAFGHAVSDAYGRILAGLQTR